MTTFSVHDQSDFERVYDEDDTLTIRRGDLRALLDLATGSMDFGSGFWDNEQVEIARKVAGLLGIDLMLVTPFNFTCVYNGQHQWVPSTCTGQSRIRWMCTLCRHTSDSVEKPPAQGVLPAVQSDQS